MRISAKADYAIRAMLELALADAAVVLTCDEIGAAQGVPPKFLRNVIMHDLRRAGLVASTRGPEGGYRLARAATAISLADIMRAVDGPLATVQDQAPQDVHYSGTAEVLQPVWIAVRASLRNVLDNVHLGHLAAGQLPRKITKLLDDPAAWESV
jgi:Rrf2 family protein